MAKVYYWIKVSDEFFKQKEMKKLRKIAGGDTYTIIYLKMLLLAAKQNNRLYFDGIEDNFAEELAMELDEDSENVKMTLSFLQKYKLIQIIAQDEYELTRCDEMVGQLSDAALRKRRSREKQKQLACDNVTKESHYIEIEKDIYIEEKKIDLEKEMKEIRSYYKGTKDKATADKKLPKLINKYGKEQLIRAIERYNSFMDKERSRGFKDRQYMGEGRFWNTQHVNYLDDVWKEEIKPTQQPREIVANVGDLF